MKLKHFLVLLFVFFCGKFFAQNTNSINLNSENEFPFSQIYNIAENTEGFMLICSESGVYEFDGLEHRKIPWKNDKKDEILNFETDEFGNVYGTGLKNRIYKIHRDSIEFIIDWNKNILQYIHYYIYNNKIYLPSKTDTISVYDINSKTMNQFKVGSFTEAERYIEPHLIKNNEIYLKLVDGIPQKILIYNFETKVTRTAYEGELDDKGTFFEFNDATYYLRGLGKKEILKYSKIQKFEPVNFFFKNNTGWYRTYSTKDYLFTMGITGLEIYNSDFKFQSRLLEKKHITGIVSKGNALWVSTLNNGIYFFSNFKAKLYNNLNSNLSINFLDKLECVNDKIFVAENKKSVWYLDENEKLKLLTKGPKEGITAFKYDLSSDQFYLGKKEFIYQYSITDQISVVDSFPNIGNKDVDKLGDYAIYGNTYGFYVSSIASNDDLLKNFIPSSYIDSIPLFIRGSMKGRSISLNRTTKVLINPKDSSSWFIDGEGLWKLNKSGKNQITSNGKNLIAVDLKIDKNYKIWFSTSTKIYTVEGDTAKLFFQFSEKRKDVQINAINLSEKEIIVASNQGIFQIDKSGNELNNWRKNNGLPTENIFRALVSKNKLYAISNQGLSAIKLEDLTNLIENDVFISAVTVNDSAVNFEVENNFNYDENNLVIKLNAVDLQSYNNRTYYYRLTGAQKEWISVKSNQEIRYPNLTSGKYKFEVYVEAFNGQKSDIKSFSFNIALPFWQTWWFILAVLILIGLVIYAYFLIRLRRVKREKELQNKIIQSEIDGLKAQMNPHFIFNALNSIQNLIIQKDVGQSNLYLGKFADLLRSVLKYSTKEKISLAEEIELLSVYLDLERLRFKDKLQTEINCEENLKQFQIPPLLLQPYIENSLKHGLLHSEKESKLLSISFTKNKDYVTCSIYDNGIGRDASQKINERRAKYHESFATQSLEKRVNLINQTTDKKTVIEIKDLAEGTEVVVSFPI